MTGSFDRAIRALTDHGCDPKPTGPDTAKARCPLPGHGKRRGDRAPSLWVHPRKDGKGTRVECMALCDYYAVLDEVGLHPRDLYDDEPIRQALKPVTHHRYPGGGYKTRYPDPATDGKDKKMRYHGPKQNGQLYLADKIPPGATLAYLCESEKAAELIAAVGRVAVATGGAAMICDLRPLDGVDMIVAVVDRDNSGLKWAANQRELLEPLDTTVGWVRCPLDIPHADIGEHFDAELTLAQLEVFDPFTTIYDDDDDDDDDDDEPEPHADAAVAGNRKGDAAAAIEFTTVALADITAEPVRWLWKDRLPLGKLIMLDGDPSTGKSTLTLEIASVITNGGTWPDGTTCEHPGRSGPAHRRGQPGRHRTAPPGRRRGARRQRPRRQGHPDR
jgi:hypothetical protein